MLSHNVGLSFYFLTGAHDSPLNLLPKSVTVELGRAL